jgi:hypothetical protein
MPRRLMLMLFLTTAGLIAAASAPSAHGQNPAEPSQRSKCEVAGKTDIAIDCKFSTSAAGNAETKPQIALTRALISFENNHDSYMHIDLTFQNLGKAAFPESRTVYIEFDDPAGQNFIRRPLPHVDFRKLAPGETKTFSDGFLAPALRPGRYIVQLWVPSSDAAIKFQPAHNFLLANAALANSATGLNEIAVLTVQR